MLVQGQYYRQIRWCESTPPLEGGVGSHTPVLRGVGVGCDQIEVVPLSTLGDVLDILKGKAICPMFYKPSARISAFFEAAMCRLGGTVASITAHQSSTAQGKSLTDKINTHGCYGNAIILRYPVAGSSRSAAHVFCVPIINAAGGVDGNPRQAFSDVYTIQEDLRAVSRILIHKIESDSLTQRNLQSFFLTIPHQEATTTITHHPKTKNPTIANRTKQTNKNYSKESLYHLKISSDSYKVYAKEKDHITLLMKCISSLHL
ncbi:hypothetical protein KEM48_003826 [Puccinia striiformis f. sp. tritici PST-130]|nr:hypothetical protein KEM48_003826 [Puccinia striiformis f. sp. tritici PST-130]